MSDCETLFKKCKIWSKLWKLWRYFSSGEKEEITKKIPHRFRKISRKKRFFHSCPYKGVATGVTNVTSFGIRSEQYTHTLHIKYCSALMPKEVIFFTLVATPARSNECRLFHCFVSKDMAEKWISLEGQGGWVWCQKCVQIRKGKTGRVLFWFSVQTQQQSCDKDEMMLADEGRVIRFQNKNHSSKHWRFDKNQIQIQGKNTREGIFLKIWLLKFAILNQFQCIKSKITMKMERTLVNSLRISVIWLEELCSEEQRSGKNSCKISNMCYDVACFNPILALVYFLSSMHYFQF